MVINPTNMASAFQPGYGPQMPSQYTSTNAKAIDYKSPGSAAAGYGYTPDNIYTNLNKLYNDYKVQGVTSGGNKDIWKAMEKHNAKRASEGNSQSALFNQFLSTGQIPAGLDPNYAISMLDFGVRETGRGQQNKEGFFDSVLGKVVGIGATALGSVVGGPIGGALVGGTIGGVSGGGLPGIALGALGGYAGAGGLNSLGVPTNLLNVPNPLAEGLSNLGGALGGTVNNVNAFMPADVAARAAGGSMGILDSIGGFLSSNAGGLINAGVNYFGNQQAQKEYEKAAQTAFQQAQFQPYNINTPLGQASFQGNNAFGVLSPQMAAIAQQQLQMANENFAGYSAFNPQNYAQSYYDNIKALNAPKETWEDNNLLSSVYNTGGWGSTTGANTVFSANQARMLQDAALRQTALTAGGQESDRLFNAYMKSAQNYAGTMGIPFDLINQGLNAGANRSSANAGASQYPLNAAMMQYGSDQSFWDSLGSTAGDLLQNTMNQYQNMSKQQQQYAYNPNAAFSNFGV